MLRDKIQTQGYFDSYILEQEKSLKEHQLLLQEKGNAEQQHRLRHGIWLIQRNIDNARYSRGDNVADIAQDYQAIFAEKLALDLETKEDYGYWNYTGVSLSLSYAILLGIPQAEIQKYEVLNCHKNAIESFAIFGSVTEDIRKEIATSKSSQKFTGFLIDLIFNTSDKSEQGRLLEEHLKKWVRSMRGSQFIQTPEKTLKSKTYGGVWCYEAAAVAKMLDISDEHLKNNPHYPYDMVHWV